MSRNELTALDPDCIALALAAFVWLTAFCWAIWFVRSGLGDVAGVLAAAAGEAGSDGGAAPAEMLLMTAGFPPAARLTMPEAPAGGAAAVLDAFGSGTWPVGPGPLGPAPVLGLLATLRAVGCWREMAAADADVEIATAELMHLE